MNDEMQRPELVFGLVTPIGTDTSTLANTLVGALADYGYESIIIKLSEHVSAPPGRLSEPEDERVKRLIRAGNDFCASQVKVQPEGDPAAIARIAIREIQRSRVALLRQDGYKTAIPKLKRSRPSTAYILHSLKRPAEVSLLRRVYGDQFVLVGCQGTVEDRHRNLAKRPMSVTTQADKDALAQALIELDGAEDLATGQRVNETYPSSDFFLSEPDATRVVKVLFGEPIAPEVGEFAMFVAWAAKSRSLAASRKVGAAIVVSDAVVATGFNEVPEGSTPDVLKGQDTSEQFKRDSVRDTLERLVDAGLLTDIAKHDSLEGIMDKAIDALDGGHLLSVIEYQRAVHAEAKAIDDATTRGVSTVGGSLYVTTYPCHLCFKHALSVKIKTIRYIEPYPKSRAQAMYPGNGTTKLVPYEGVAPRRYRQVFDARPPFESDPSGRFEQQDSSVAKPLLEHLRNDEDRNAEERLAIKGLSEEHR